MQTAIVCRNCGHAELVEVTTAQQELLTVGMLDRACPACKRDTRWGRALELRRKERRHVERRKKTVKAPEGSEKRGSDRRSDRRRQAWMD